MKAKVAALFTKIENDILAMEEDERRDAINILAALRGPDSQNTEAKSIGTLPVRLAVFPRLFTREGSHIKGIDGVPWSGHTNSLPTTFQGIEARIDYINHVNNSEHYSTHMLYAFKALAQED